VQQITQPGSTDVCPLIKCSAAHQLAIKLKDEYDGVRFLLLYMVSLPFIKLVVKGAGSAQPVIEQLLARLGQWAAANNVAPWLISVIANITWAVKSDIIPSEVTDAINAALIPELDSASFDRIWELAYLQVTCSANKVTVTQEIINNWGASILLDEANLDVTMRHLMVECINTTPFYVWDQSAQSGAQHYMSECAEW
jgi:hypothetical protein